MEKIKKDFSLKGYNTFGIVARADYFISVRTEEELYRLFTESDVIRGERLLILGGGSNILFTGDFNGLVVKMDLRGIETLKDQTDYAEIKVYAGENWDELVRHCVERRLGGLENLSLIPGTVGAAPVQNIGAYGSEIGDVLVEVNCWDRSSSQAVTLSLEALRLGYRTSIFKTEARDRYVILSVTLRLTKEPVFNIGYGSLEQELKQMGVKELSLEAIRDAVISIRRRKLPDPPLVGNAGSFFKNPDVSAEVFNDLKAVFPGLAAYPQPDGSRKLAAGWLIEHCGWKGYRRGDAGVHHEQALVLVNYGNATGLEILQLATRIKQSVRERFGVELEIEVNIL
jgi:UDP-N-acetylmuramate dehydrogenase